MNEVPDVQQVPGEPSRRLFVGGEFELMIWQGSAGVITAFQLMYDRGRQERMIEWRRGRGLFQYRVDTGEGRGGRHKASPLLMADPVGEDVGPDRDPAMVAERLRAAAGTMDPQVAGFVVARLERGV